METLSLGKVTVATAGTPTQIKNLLPAALPGWFPANHKVYRINVQQAGNTGKVSFGTSTVNAATLAGTIYQLLPEATSALKDSYRHEAPDSGNQLQLDDYYLDVTVSGEGALISIDVT